MVVFAGSRNKDGGTTVYWWNTDAGRGTAHLLPMYLDEKNSSPTGLEWGYNGSGPAQLAYALLRFYLGKFMGSRVAGKWAQDYHQKFKDEVIAGLPREGWQMVETRIFDWLLHREDE